MICSPAGVLERKFCAAALANLPRICCDTWRSHGATLMRWKVCDMECRETRRQIAGNKACVPAVFASGWLERVWITTHQRENLSLGGVFLCGFECGVGYCFCKRITHSTLRLIRLHSISFHPFISQQRTQNQEIHRPPITVRFRRAHNPIGQMRSKAEFTGTPTR